MKASSYLFLLCLAGLAMSVDGCDKKCGSEHPFPNYDFEIPATLSPAQASFRIGDTIRIRSHFFEEVKERRSQNIFLLEDFEFYPLSTVARIDTLPANFSTIWSHFDVLVDSSRIVEYGQSALGLRYLYENDHYTLSFRLVPKQKGTYYLEFGADISLDRFQTFPGKCDGKEIDDHTLMNGGADTNLDLLATSPDEHFNTWIPAKLDERAKKFGGYCFVVTE